MIPIANFFNLDHGDNQTNLLFKCANTMGYFNLAPWGVNLKQSWKLVKNLDAKGKMLISFLDGQHLEVKISPTLIQEAL